MLVVFGVISLAIALFVAQPIPIDTTAIAVMVSLIVLEPWTGVGPTEGVSGFSNPATITVLAMFILSEGVRQTGAIQILTRTISRYTGHSGTKQLLAIIDLSGPPAGFINNTPIVAILIPAVYELARKATTSPSKLLLPLSFAAMMGGTLTVIGTSSNLLASDVRARQGGPGAEPFGMFEFTQLGVVVLAVGVLYLLTVGRYLTPARIEPTADPGEEFGMSEYLTDLVVREGSWLVGTQIRDIRRDETFDMDVIQIVRNSRTLTRGIGDEWILAGDILAVRADQETLQHILGEDNIDLLPEVIEEFDEETASSIERAIVSDLDTVPRAESTVESDGEEETKRKIGRKSEKMKKSSERFRKSSSCPVRGCRVGGFGWLISSVDTT